MEPLFRIHMQFITLISDKELERTKGTQFYDHVDLNIFNVFSILMEETFPFPF